MRASEKRDTISVRRCGLAVHVGQRAVLRANQHRGAAFDVTPVAISESCQGADKASTETAAVADFLEDVLDEDVQPEEMDVFVRAQKRMGLVVDDVELDDVKGTERHLFYIACMRVRDRLLATVVKSGSDYLADLKSG